MQILWCFVGLTGPKAKEIDSVEGKGKKLGGGTGGGGGVQSKQKRKSALAHRLPVGCLVRSLM